MQLPLTIGALTTVHGMGGGPSVPSTDATTLSASRRRRKIHLHSFRQPPARD